MAASGSAKSGIERLVEFRHARAYHIGAGWRDLLFIKTDIDAARIRPVLKTGIDQLELRDIRLRIEDDAVVSRCIDGARHDIDSDLRKHGLDGGEHIGRERRGVIGQKRDRLVAIDLRPAGFLQKLLGLFRIVGIRVDTLRDQLVGDIGAICRLGSTA